MDFRGWIPPEIFYVLGVGMAIPCVVYGIGWLVLHTHITFQ